MSRTKRKVPEWLLAAKRDDPSNTYVDYLLERYPTDKTPGSPVFTANGIDVDTPRSRKLQKKLKVRRMRKDGKRFEL